VDVKTRGESPIIGLKTFNNWIKSVLIGKRAPQGGRLRVLDIGCGKGGDLQKWQKAGTEELVGIGACPRCLIVGCLSDTKMKDIAKVSVDHAHDRWRRMGGRKFRASFHALDCYNVCVFQSDAP
jgi:mRNA (guanine-N7-)-methyltransferase